MMTKEHFVEEYGAAVHTIGWGGSGGQRRSQCWPEWWR